MRQARGIYQPEPCFSIESGLFSVRYFYLVRLTVSASWDSPDATGCLERNGFVVKLSLSDFCCTLWHVEQLFGMAE